MAKAYYYEWKEALSMVVEFEDEYTRPTVEKGVKGLYLLEQCALDPHTHQIYYWVKVGQSKEMKSRMKGYATDNPAAFLLDVIEIDREQITESERACQMKLIQKAIARGKDTQEWFLVDEKTFFEIEEKKFKYFFE